MTNLPPLSEIDFRRTFRLIPSEYSYPVLEDLWDDDEEMADVYDLDGATNDRMQAQEDNLPLGIHQDELVAAIPYASIINAAFTHPHPEGARFNTADRGAWYAGLELESAQAEVTYHHWRWLEEIGVTEDEVTKTVWHADFKGEYHDLRSDDATKSYATCLAPNVETGHPNGQALTVQLLATNSLGLVFPSVRNSEGTNIVCFRPALVMNVQRGATYRYVWKGQPSPSILTEAV